MKIKYMFFITTLSEKTLSVKIFVGKNFRHLAKKLSIFTDDPLCMQLSSVKIFITLAKNLSLFTDKVFSDKVRQVVVHHENARRNKFNSDTYGSANYLFLKSKR